MENTTNPYLVEKTVLVKETIEVEKNVTIIDWSKVPNGTYMTAKIKGTPCEGFVYNDPKVYNTQYFCQNNFDGTKGPETFGLLYGWQFSQNEDGTHSCWVTDIDFPPKPDNFPSSICKVEIGDGSYECYVISGEMIKVGCQTITKEQILNVIKAMENYSK